MLPHWHCTTAAALSRPDALPAHKCTVHTSKGDASTCSAKQNAMRAPGSLLWRHAWQVFATLAVELVGALPPFGSVSGGGKLSAPHSAWHLGCWPTSSGNVLHNGTPACWASSRRCPSRGRSSSSSAVDEVLHLPGLSRGDTGSIFSGSVDLSSHVAWAIMAGAFAYKGEAGQAGREAPGRSPPLMVSASC